jgi:hypothetical protein
MTKKTIKKILLGTFSFFALMIIVLAVHIYVVTKPKVDEHTRIMARIDINKPIDQQDANKITAWLYQQNGVDHVLCNPKTSIVVFTYSPLKANANSIAENFKNDLNYSDAKRYIPTEAEMQGGCPVASTSFTYKAYRFVKHIF